MKNTYVLGLGASGVSIIEHLHRLARPIEVFDNRLHPPGLSQLQQKWPHIPVHLGPWTAEQLCQAEEIVVSPGLSLNDPALTAARHQGIPIIGDIECFVRMAQAPIIAITGTNAKGTVTTLLGHMIQAAGFKVLVGGNIGIPALALLHHPTPDYYVLELSSFQLESTYSLQAKAAVILNLSEDHLDRHGSMAAYLSAKQVVYHQAEHCIVNRDQANLWAHVPQQAFSFGQSEPQNEQELGLRQVHGQWYLAHGNINLCALDQLKIKGQHNALNALAALALGLAVELKMAPMLDALQAFAGLEHRCQWVLSHHGIDWYNDSKATNVGATLAAVYGLGPHINGKIILIAGGQGKGQDFSPLREPIKDYCRTVIVLGQDAPLLAEALRDSVPLVLVENLAQAVQHAQLHAQTGDAVLLSPACASLDMFKNYEDRGTQFVACVHKLQP